VTSGDVSGVQTVAPIYDSHHKMGPSLIKNRDRSIILDKLCFFFMRQVSYRHINVDRYYRSMYTCIRRMNHDSPDITLQKSYLNQHKAEMLCLIFGEKIQEITCIVIHSGRHVLKDFKDTVLNGNLHAPHCTNLRYIHLFRCTF
jgi:hypothetical protein